MVRFESKGKLEDLGLEIKTTYNLGRNNKA
jgi:hypothetical protein